MNWIGWVLPVNFRSNLCTRGASDAAQNCHHVIPAELIAGRLSQLDVSVSEPVAPAARTDQRL